jgi:hypothetical protein
VHPQVQPAICLSSDALLLDTRIRSRRVQASLDGVEQCALQSLVSAKNPRGLFVTDRPGHATESIEAMRQQRVADYVDKYFSASGATSRRITMATEHVAVQSSIDDTSTAPPGSTHSCGYTPFHSAHDDDSSGYLSD